SFDTAASVWTPSSQLVWGHARDTAIDGHWRGGALGARSDTYLTSPVLMAATDAPLRLSFSHRYSFEAMAGTAFDGGVLELTTDGVTWQDLATWVAPGYGDVLDGNSGNPLAGRS